MQQAGTAADAQFRIIPPPLSIQHLPARSEFWIRLNRKTGGIFFGCSVEQLQNALSHHARIRFKLHFPDCPSVGSPNSLAVVS